MVKDLFLSAPASLSSSPLPGEDGQAPAQDVAADSTRESHEFLTPEEAESEWEASHHYPPNRISPTEVMSSRSKYRIKEADLMFVDGTTEGGGTADIVLANILNNQKFTGVKLAVKKFKFFKDHDQVLALFAHELRLQSALNHENIVKLVAFVEKRSSGIAWLVLPWMANGNLHDFLQRETYEIPERISLLYDVTCAVEYLHTRDPPICYGDLKSFNILVNDENRAVITDFGAARSFGMASPQQPSDYGVPPSAADESSELGQTSIPGQSLDIEDLTLTGPGWSLRWAAPEVVNGESPTFASDIWSFGWICWEIFTNSLPFEGVDSHTAIILRIVDRKLPTLSEDFRFSLISPLRNLIEECWRLDPKTRPSASGCKERISRMPRIIPIRKDVQEGVPAYHPKLLRVTGDMHVSGFRISNGLQYITRALEMARTSGDTLETASALLSLGRAHCIQCDYAEAEGAFREAESLHASQGNVEGVTDTLYAVAELHKRRCEFSEAEELYIKAQSLYARLENRLGIANAISGLADIQRLQCKFNLAESGYRKATDFYLDLSDTLGITRAKCGLGDIFCQKGVPDLAESFYQKARDTIEQGGYPLELASALYGLGHVRRLQGMYTEAAGCFQEAEVIHTRIQNQLGTAEIRYGMGDLYRMQEDYDGAESAYVKAQQLFDIAHHPVGVADAMCGLAHVRRVQGRDSEAEDLFNQARGIYRRGGYEMGVANSALGLAAVYLERLEYDQASSAITKALGFYTRVGIPSLKARALMMLALAHQIQAEIDEAIRCVGEAASIYSDLGDKSSALDCKELLDELRGSNGKATS